MDIDDNSVKDALAYLMSVVDLEIRPTETAAEYDARMAHEDRQKALKKLIIHYCIDVARENGFDDREISDTFFLIAIQHGAACEKPTRLVMLERYIAKCKELLKSARTYN